MSRHGSPGEERGNLANCQVARGQVDARPALKLVAPHAPVSLQPGLGDLQLLRQLEALDSVIPADRFFRGPPEGLPNVEKGEVGFEEDGARVDVVHAELIPLASGEGHTAGYRFKFIGQVQRVDLLELYTYITFCQVWVSVLESACVTPIGVIHGLSLYGKKQRKTNKYRVAYCKGG